MNFFRVYEVTPIFSWILTFVVIFLHALISPIISVLTLFKGTFFTATVSNFRQLLCDKYLFLR